MTLRRPRKPRDPLAQSIRFRVAAADRTTIEARAAAVGMGVSAYVRAAALNHPIRAIADQDAILDLTRFQADLGRLGGLLKLWLAERRGEGLPASQVDALYREIAQTVRKADAVMDRIA